MSTVPAERILLSGPDVGDAERKALLAAFDSGWIAPVGPDLAAFEQELADYLGVEACVALASGTAALHLALLEAGVGPGDTVIVQTATFAASAFAVCYTGARPVFCDVDSDSWTLSVELLEQYLVKAAAKGRLPKAVIPVDLYGSCADYPKLLTLCESYGIWLIEDGAEAVGSMTADGMAGALGHIGAVSFNGNKMITTSGGGALLGSREIVERARHLATQARQPYLHYEHKEIGFNYRMSNLLAAIGRSQLARIETLVEQRTATASAYREAPGLAEISWNQQRHTVRPNHWLSVGLLPARVKPARVCNGLAALGIEARPAWAPMHQQPVFNGAEVIGGAVADDLFARGICLPSGSGLRSDQIALIIDAVSTLLEEPA